jgi:hypothetical protein
VGYARQRGRDANRSFRDYIAVEFSGQRRSYYVLASHVIDADRGTDEVGESLVQIVLKLTSGSLP